jgi:flagellar hook-associated protein 1 FlgK
LESNTSLLVDSLETRQEELAGVSIDEETVNLLKYQRAFAAAARFITSVDELIRTVVEGMGIVGR